MRPRRHHAIHRNRDLLKHPDCPEPSTETSATVLPGERSRSETDGETDDALAESFVDSFKSELIADRVGRIRRSRRAAARPTRIEDGGAHDGPTDPSDEGLVVSRQGSGVFVRERTARPVGLRPVVERAFQRPQVSVDFFGFTAETLLSVVQEPLDKIRAGAHAPESIAIRILVPRHRPADGAALPRRRPRRRPRVSRALGHHDAPPHPSDHRRRRRARRARPGQQRHVEIRVHNLAPLFKAYLLNRDELFFGVYPIAQRRVTLGDQPHEIYDLMGKDATLFHHATSDDDTSSGSQYIEQMQTWFDTIWTTVSRAAKP